ncbi:hypothetical protein V866_000371 [Kwoniella sp. B9012]
MSNTQAHTKPVLVIGATGNQGSAVVKALVDINNASTIPKYRILALTRDSTSEKARFLKNLSNVEIVQGDLDQVDVIFEEVLAKVDKVYGVFSVQAVPLKEDPHYELKQGM